MIFAHFLHHQLLRLYRIQERVQNRRQLLGYIRNALRWSVFLTSEPLIVPTTDLIHSPLLPEIANDLVALVAYDAIELVGSSLDSDEIASQVFEQHKDLRIQQRLGAAVAKRRLRSFKSALRRRHVPTTSFVAKGWVKSVQDFAIERRTFSSDQLREALNALPRRPSAVSFAKILKEIPERIGSHAFRWDVVEELGVFEYDTSPRARTHFELALAWQWLIGYVREYHAQILGTIPGIGPVHCGLQRTHPQHVIDLRKHSFVLKALGLDSAFYALTFDELLRLRFEPRVAILRDAIIDRVSVELSPRYRREPLHDEQFAVTCDDVRRAARNATSALSAVLRAAEVSSKWFLQQRKLLLSSSGVLGAESVASREVAVPIGFETAPVPRITSGPGSPVVIAVVVALSEELTFILDALEALDCPAVIDRGSPNGQLAYICDRATAEGHSVRLVFVLVGKGQERAAAQTTIVVHERQPQMVVSLGIAGALSTDIGTGDVAVGQEVRSYLANAKARPDGEGRFEFALAGEGVPCDALLVSRADQLSFTSRPALRAGHDRQRARAGTLEALADFKVLCGPLACGPAVSAADEFKAWLLRSKRDYLAVDTESSGAGTATALAGMLRLVRFAAIRGISDGGDKHKNTLEAETKGAARRLATTAALEVLLMLIDELPWSAMSS